MQTETLIVGGGLSGLSIAMQLQERNQDYAVVEARSRFGGRMLTDTSFGGYFDLGPAWFWPGQPRIQALIQKLGLQIFEQYYHGDLNMEDERGQIHRGRGYSSMQGSYRVVGGMAAIIDSLTSLLNPDQLYLSWPVTEIKKSATGITVTCADGRIFEANRVILALPPRVTATISFTPALPDPALQALQNIPTWMAGQAKAVAVYSQPFWRKEGLSGDAMSRIGPMIEIHDASVMENGPYGLFGFIGVPPEGRRNEDDLKRAVQEQFIRLFGTKAANSKALYIKDWAFDRFTSTTADLQPLRVHPHYGLPQRLQNLWEGALLFSGTETAAQFGGYIEGALEAAEQTCILIKNEAYA